MICVSLNKTGKGAVNKFSILGTYEGEALDTNITNRNGLDITSEVMQTVFESDDYKQGIQYGWFIGFLGHPEDPNCMDFRNGCIVMTDGYLDDNGKVHAKFNLIDTPVGQIVKKFIDAGVRFGISIRGAGDITGHTVEPDTFVFRGFDLVSFPAYPESIPAFTEISAATDMESRKKYQAVCSAIKNNITSITSASEINIMQKEFAPQSDTYAMLEKRKADIKTSLTFNMDKEKLNAMTDLYLNTADKLKTLSEQIDSERQNVQSIKSAYDRKITALKRITETQLSDTLNSLDKVTASCSILKNKNIKLKRMLDVEKESNLIYKQKIQSSTEKLQKNRKIINDLNLELRETVTASTQMKNHTSNLDEDNKRLRVELDTCKQVLHEYQESYANLYASALGVNFDNISITANTSVENLQKLIVSATNTVDIPCAPYVDNIYDEDDCDDIVTM